MEKCESHSIVKGDVERSTKEDGTVIRKRRCDVCEDLIKTIEMTEDQLAHILEKGLIVNRALRAEMAHYRAVAEAVKRMFDAERRVRHEMKIQYEISEEDKL